MRLSRSRSRCLLGTLSRSGSRSGAIELLPSSRSFVHSALRFSKPTNRSIPPQKSSSEPAPDHAGVAPVASKHAGPQTRTRFAPSPTGLMHLGSLRTALFNYLLAKASGGQFILRVEDTDQTRIVPGAEQAIYDDLRWAQLTCDEGPEEAGPYGPYKQSERLHIYKLYTEKLVQEGKAYRCFCDHRTLDAFTVGGSGDPNRAFADGAFRARMRYPGKCREVSRAESDQRAADGEGHVVRFRSDRVFSFVDAVYGRYEKRELEEDFVLMKSDGFPTYHLANVVDDTLMKITHVIRGEEWLISTPKHLALYDAFGLEPPVFGHLGLLVGPSGEKLSKRAGDMSVRAFRERGFFPLVIKNWLALHGSRLLSPGSGGNEIASSMRDLETSFSLNFTKGPIIPSWTKLTRIQQVQLARERERALSASDSASDAGVDANLSRSVMRVMHAVESLRTSNESDQASYTFTDLSGGVTGTIKVDQLGQISPALEPISGLAAHDFDTKHVVDANTGGGSSLDLEAVRAVNRLVGQGPNLIKVPTDIVLAAANLIWRPTAAKFLNSVSTLDKIAILDCSPRTLWQNLLDGLKQGQALQDVFQTEHAAYTDTLRKAYSTSDVGDGQVSLVELEKKLVALLHAHVRQALAGDHREKTPSTKNAGCVLGPEETMARLTMAIELWDSAAGEGRKDQSVVVSG